MYLIHNLFPMHKLTKITPLFHKEIWIKYKNKMRITKWKNKEAFYVELAEYYRVHYNTIRKIIKRAYAWFKKNWITIKKLMSDNWLEFTTHHKLSRPKHSFEIALVKLNIKHSYTRVRRPQTNWKIERFWKIFEEQFFRKYEFSSNKDFNMKVKDWFVFYNTKRKHWWIQYITPMQKLEDLLTKNKVYL